MFKRFESNDGNSTILQQGCSIDACDGDRTQSCVKNRILRRSHQRQDLLLLIYFVLCSSNWYTQFGLAFQQQQQRRTSFAKTKTSRQEFQFSSFHATIIFNYDESDRYQSRHSLTKTRSSRIFTDNSSPLPNMNSSKDFNDKVDDIEEDDDDEIALEYDDDEYESSDDSDSNNDPNRYQLKPAKSICVTGVVPKSAPLNEAVVSVLNENNCPIAISLEEANDLIDIGAVWAKMEGLSEQDVLDLYDNDRTDANSNSRALYADLRTTSSKSSIITDVDNMDAYVEQMENQRFRRILSPSWINAGTDIRIYPNPRRFTSACSEMTKERLLYEDTTFIVVDKPPMLPTQPDASNYYECCPGCVDDNLGPFYDINDDQITNRPYICHRVDSCVGGCVVLSKTPLGQRVFQKYQRDRALRKMYLAVTTNPVPLGMHIHWMWAPQSTRGKKGGPPCQLISFTPPESKRKARQFWKRCVLEVTECKPIHIDPSSTGYNPSSNQQHYQNTIRLVTGRKHQVRAQLASLNCPIIRDTLYEPIAGLTLDLLERSSEAEEAMDVGLAKCAVPTQPIGLQAAGILFGRIRVKANPPWWAATTSAPTSSSR